jgi:hypothetical protein
MGLVHLGLLKSYNFTLTLPGISGLEFLCITLFHQHIWFQTLSCDAGKPFLSCTTYHVIRSSLMLLSNSQNHDSGEMFFHLRCCSAADGLAPTAFANLSPWCSQLPLLFGSCMPPLLGCHCLHAGWCHPFLTACRLSTPRRGCPWRELQS